MADLSDTAYETQLRIHALFACQSEAVSRLRIEPLIVFESKRVDDLCFRDIYFHAMHQHVGTGVESVIRREARSLVDSLSHEELVVVRFRESLESPKYIWSRDIADEP